MKLGVTIRARLRDEAEILTFRVLKGEAWQIVAGVSFNRSMANPVFAKPPRPNLQRFRASYYAQRRLANGSRTRSRRWNMFPVKKGKFGARTTKCICIKKVVSRNVILINCLF